MKAFLKEVERFASCSDNVVESEIGLQQFYLYESHGTYPEAPDPYFHSLLNGKKWWEWTLNFIADTYNTNDWVGWYCYAKDFINDPAGFRQLRQRLGQTPINPQVILEAINGPRMVHN